MDRKTIEQLANRASFGFRVETAAEQGDGTFRVTGVMNSFGVMRSRRVLHPQGFIDWMAKYPGATVPMLSNHGEWDSARLATIGIWDSFAYDAQRGMVWGGTVGRGTQLCDEARTLLGQKLVSGLSLGWNPTAPARWVTLKDADLDPFFKSAMERESVDECYAFWTYEPVEGSIVDVADDRAGKLAAREQDGALQAKLDALAARVEAAMAQAAGGDVDARIAAALDKFGEGLSNELVAVMENLLADRDADYGAALLDDTRDCGHGGTAGRGGSSTMAAAIARSRELVRKHK